MAFIQKNMAGWDRVVRVLVGIILWVIGPILNLVELPMLGIITLGVLGTIAILSGLTAYCFLYQLAGFNTLDKDKAEQQLFK